MSNECFVLFQEFCLLLCSFQVPWKLSKRFPHLVYVEETKFLKPGLYEFDQLYGNKTCQWQENYAVHLYYRFWKTSEYYHEEPNSTNIKTLNSTFGQIARMILFSNPDVISDDGH